MRIPRRASAAFVCALGAAGAAPPASAQWLQYPTPGIPRLANGSPDLTAPAPKSADGTPDLSGVWLPEVKTLRYLINFAADFPPGKVPMQPWAEAAFKSALGKDDPSAHCLPLGLPAMDETDHPFKIAQTRGMTMVLYETFTLFRQIFTDGRALPKDPNPAWLGYSIGHWDADTFVVETAGFNGKTWLDTDGHPTSGALRVTERFRRRSFGRMELRLTVDDPKTYTQPWTVAIDLNLLPDTDLLEYVCESDTRILGHLGPAALVHAERKQITVPREVLAQYVGTYEIQPGVDIEVTLSGDQLRAEVGLMGSLPLFPESESSFSLNLADLRIQFMRNPQGAVAYLVLHQGGPDQVAVRK